MYNFKTLLTVVIRHFTIKHTMYCIFLPLVYYYPKFNTGKFRLILLVQWWIKRRTPHSSLTVANVMYSMGKPLCRNYFLLPRSKWVCIVLYCADERSRWSYKAFGKTVMITYLRSVMASSVVFMTFTMNPDDCDISWIFWLRTPVR